MLHSLFNLQTCVNESLFSFVWSSDWRRILVGELPLLLAKERHGLRCADSEAKRDIIAIRRENHDGLLLEVSNGDSPVTVGNPLINLLPFVVSSFPVREKFDIIENGV